MKLWSWGNAPVGVVNQTALTDDGSLYAETQCGAMETQLDFDFLQPGDTRAWREWWIPLREIGGLTCASETVGAKLQLAPVLDTHLVKLSVALCPAKLYDNALVTLTVANKVLMKETCSISPEKPWIHETTVSAAEVGDKPITLVVQDSVGQVLLENTQDRKLTQLEAVDKGDTSSTSTSEAQYLLGLKHENFDNREQAREAYRQSLLADDGHKEAHLRLGLLLLRAAQFREADAQLSRAEELGVPESSYYRGIIALYEDRLADAQAYFESGRKSKSHFIAAGMGLGKVALRKKDWARAIQCFSEAAEHSTATVAPATLLAIAMRHAGRREEANAQLQQVLASDPLNHPALHEMASGNYAESAAVQQKLSRILRDDYQYFIDLACYYVDAGLLGDALDVLKTAWSQSEKAMTAYLGAFISHKTEDEGAAGSWLEKARAASPDYGFPSRLEEVQALAFALLKDPQDSLAKYFLGNFLYAHERCAEAIQLWTDALVGMGAFDVLYRNLGVAAWQRNNNPSEAIEWFEKALAANPDNQDVYLHLDGLYKQLNLADKRQQLLTRIKSLPGVREDVHKHRITMMVELGHYEEAIALMAGETFIPLEMDQSFHGVYVQALMMRAKASLDAGCIEDAIQDYLKMLEYPANHGVGAPTTRAQARIYYQLGLAYEKLGQYQNAIRAWHEAASEHHSRGQELFNDVQMALDKISRYSELGLEE
jgi:tetratricopeptide (TPR) repeat protein